MTALLEWLEDLDARDTRVRAVLRRSLAFPPGAHVPSFPYVEPFSGGWRNEWQRRMHYLVAGLWAAHWKPERPNGKLSLGRAAALHQTQSGSQSTERRFISVLDADEEQLPHRLRQMTSLLKDYTIDFDQVLRGLLFWNHEERRTQIAWARDFYRDVHQQNETNLNPGVLQ